MKKNIKIIFKECLKIKFAKQLKNILFENLKTKANLRKKI